MAWAAAKDAPFALRHAVRDGAGALVSGVAGSLTGALSDPLGAASALAVTFAEIGSTGWYDATFTPDTEGTWILTVTNPAAPVSDGQEHEYPIQVGRLGLPGELNGAYGLTTRALVKSFLGVSSTQHDGLIDALVSGITSQIEQRAGRHFGDYTYTETLDGNGRTSLWLPMGPLISITSVSQVQRDESGETVTALDAWRYLGVGVSTELGGGDDHRARVVRVDGEAFDRGEQNWRIVYRAGYVTIPPMLTLDATRLCVAHFRRRDLEGMVAAGNLDLTATPLDPTELDRLADRIAASWRLRLGV